MQIDTRCYLPRFECQKPRGKTALHVAVPKLKAKRVLGREDSDEMLPISPA